MSKSKGNVISPLDVSNEFGTDALRMALIIGNTPGTDLNLDVRKVGAYRKFANKVWNIARFVITSGIEFPVDDTQLNETDDALLKQFYAIARDITVDMNSYRFHLAGEKIYHYLWHTFADEVLEQSKPILTEGSKAEKDSRITLLTTIFMQSLKLLHPFMPFVTEAIWQELPNKPARPDDAGHSGKDTDLLMVAHWPTADTSS